MTARETLAGLLDAHEGFRACVYDDATGKPIGPGSKVIGHPTIGYGLALDTRGVTPRQARQLRDDALDEIDHELATRWASYGKQIDARRMGLLELAYQCGVDGLLGFHKMIRHINDREYADARVELLSSTWATQTGADRVEAIAGMIGDGLWPNEAG